MTREERRRGMGLKNAIVNFFRPTPAPDLETEEEPTSTGLICAHCREEVSNRLELKKKYGLAWHRKCLKKFLKHPESFL